MPSGIGVVANIGDAIWAELLADNGKDFLLNLGRDPGINTVADNIIEGSKPIGDIEDIHGVELDIAEIQGLYCFFAPCDLGCR